MKYIFFLLLFFFSQDIAFADSKLARKCTYDAYSLYYYTDGSVKAERSGWTTSFNGDKTSLKKGCPGYIWTVSTTRGNGKYTSVYTSSTFQSQKIKLDDAYNYDGQNNFSGSNSSNNGGNQNTLNKSVSWCTDPNVLKAMSIVGYIIYVIKVLVPIVIIITGIKNFFNTVTNQDGDIKKATFTLISKFFVGAAIFFIPLLINTIMTLVTSYDKTEAKFSRCTICLTDPSKCD